MPHLQWSVKCFFKKSYDDYAQSGQITPWLIYSSRRCVASWQVGKKLTKIWNWYSPTPPARQIPHKYSSQANFNECEWTEGQRVVMVCMVYDVLFPLYLTVSVLHQDEWGIQHSISNAQEIFRDRGFCTSTPVGNPESQVLCLALCSPCKDGCLILSLGRGFTFCILNP